MKFTKYWRRIIKTLSDSIPTKMAKFKVTFRNASINDKAMSKETIS